MFKLRLSVALIAAFALCSTAAGQAPVISYGDMNTISLVEDTAGQTVDISAANVANVNLNGFQIWMQIGDGGTVHGGTADHAARITGVDLFPAGSIFTTDQQSFPGSGSGGQSDHLWIQSQANGGDLITQDGLVARITFDTTGHFFGETSAIRFDGILDDSMNSTNFNSTSNDTIFADMARGTIVLTSRQVPEPGSMAIIAAVSSLCLIRRRRS